MGGDCVRGELETGRIALVAAELSTCELANAMKKQRGEERTV